MVVGGVSWVRLPGPPECGYASDIPAIVGSTSSLSALVQPPRPELSTGDCAMASGLLVTLRAGGTVTVKELGAIVLQAQVPRNRGNTRLLQLLLT